ncbi:MAG TPA: GntR family transcriptional regulator [Trebonia sp.]|nr:GntR family transcriptional regulator [Trebonia sp.]
MVSDRPLYVRIRDELQAQIDASHWRPGDQIPSEAALAQQFGVTRMTVRQALDQLTTSGLLVKRRGLGTFVTEREAAIRRKLNRLGSFAEELGISRASVTTSMYAQELADPPAEVAEFLPVKPGEKVVRLLRLRTAEARPVALQESWLRLMTLPSALREPLLDGSLYLTLRRRAGVEVRWAQQEMTALTATPEQAAILNIGPGTPIIATTRRTYGDNDDPVEFAHSWTRTEYPIVIHLVAEKSAELS